MTSFQEIDSADLHELMAQPDVLIVDVRNEDELLQGKIPEAIHIPLSMLPVEYQRLEGSTHVVFYCHSGIRSALAADFAVSKGIKNGYNLYGGVLAWANAGYTFVPKE
jgi:rhodanese-related sulfurtransferase